MPKASKRDPSEQDVPMFDVDGAPEFIEPKEKIWPAIAKWSDYRGAHETCDVYKRLIHEAANIADVARHQPASRRRIGPNGEMRVCAACGVTLKTRDDMAARQRDTRIADNERERVVHRPSARSRRPVA